MVMATVQKKWFYFTSEGAIGVRYSDKFGNAVEENVNADELADFFKSPATEGLTKFIVYVVKNKLI